MEIEIKLFDNRTYSCTNMIIGKLYENMATTLVFYLTEEMIDKDFYIEFEKPDGSKVSTSRLVIEDKTIKFKIPNSLLDQEGELKAEVVLRNSDNLVFKSYTMKFNILNSINATDEIKEQYPDFVSETQKVIDLIKTNGEGNKYLANDGTYKEVSSGSSDYNSLDNKPSINDIELSNNKTLEELGIQEKGDYALSSDIPTKISELENDSKFITGYTEIDPTVPSYIKEITKQDIENWNTKPSFDGDYNDLKNIPITNIEGTEAKPIYLRELQTGAYLLNGVCKPYNGSDASMVAGNAVTFVNHFETVTAIQIFYPPYNQVQYFEAYDDNYISNIVLLNNLTTKEYVDTAISNAIGNALGGSY